MNLRKLLIRALVWLAAMAFKVADTLATIYEPGTRWCSSREREHGAFLAVLAIRALPDTPHVSDLLAGLRGPDDSRTMHENVQRKNTLTSPLRYVLGRVRMGTTIPPKDVQAEFDPPVVKSTHYERHMKEAWSTVSFSGLDPTDHHGWLYGAYLLADGE